MSSRSQLFSTAYGFKSQSHPTKYKVSLTSNMARHPNGGGRSPRPGRPGRWGRGAARGGAGTATTTGGMTPATPRPRRRTVSPPLAAATTATSAPGRGAGRTPSRSSRRSRRSRDRGVDPPPSYLSDFTRPRRDLRPGHPFHCVFHTAVSIVSLKNALFADYPRGCIDRPMIHYYLEGGHDRALPGPRVPSADQRQGRRRRQDTGGYADMQPRLLHATSQRLTNPYNHLPLSTPVDRIHASSFDTAGLDGVAAMQSAMSQLQSFMNSSRSTLERLARQREREARASAAAAAAAADEADEDGDECAGKSPDGGVPPVRVSTGSVLPVADSNAAAEDAARSEPGPAVVTPSSSAPGGSARQGEEEEADPSTLEGALALHSSYLTSDGVGADDSGSLPLAYASW
ncbi:hypothetical protein THAOC_35061, partial [Thalassiosira oceanica]